MVKSIKWFEIPASDFKRAVKFYNKFLDIQLRECDMGDEKMAFFPNEDGAVSFAKGFTPSDGGSLIYFNADHKIDEMLNRVDELGGSVVQSKCQIDENKGSFALILDSEGNKIGLYEKI